MSTKPTHIVTGPDEHGSMYVYLQHEGAIVAETHGHTDMVNIDYDAEGKAVGIEILGVLDLPPLVTPALYGTPFDQLVEELIKRVEKTNGIEFVDPERVALLVDLLNPTT